MQAEAIVKERTLDRRHRISTSDFERQYLLPNKPVLLTGIMDRWPALTKWSPVFFQKEHGQAPVCVGDETLPLGEFMNRVIASTPEKPCSYLKDAVLRRISTDLMHDIEPFVPYCFPNWLLGFYLPRQVRHLLNSAQIELFVGGHGTRLGEMHFDFVHSHTVLCQVFGRKEFTIFPPDDTPWLYASGGQSAIKNVETVDAERYPLFARATPIRFVQEPGEVVFLPSGWWHTTKLLSASIAVGVNFANGTNWAALTRDVCEQFASNNPVRRAFLKAYLGMNGTWKKMQGRWTGADKLGIVPAKDLDA